MHMSTHMPSSCCCPDCGVPVDIVSSVIWSAAGFGPILFLLYVADLLQLVKRHGLHPRCYADGTQMYGFCDPSDVDALQDRLLICIDEVFSWVISNRLQLNPSKTEVLWCSSARRQHQIPTGPVRVGDTSVQPVRTVRDLGGLH